MPPPHRPQLRRVRPWDRQGVRPLAQGHLPAQGRPLVNPLHRGRNQPPVNHRLPGNHLPPVNHLPRRRNRPPRNHHRPNNRHSQGSPNRPRRCNKR